MSHEAWIAVGVIGLIFALLVWGRYAADVIIIGGVALLVFLGVLTPTEAIAGMSNPGVITVAVMYVVVCGLSETGGVTWLARKFLGVPRSLTGAQLRMFIPVTVLSAFMNNTPLVAMFIPVINDWCRAHRFSPSKFMLPLSYAAILGGTCTIIGTSTNLVVKGLWVDYWHHQGMTDDVMPSLGFFGIAWVGVPCAVIGSAFIVLTARWLLPSRKPVLALAEDPKSYTVEMLVQPGSEIDGKSIEKAGLRHLPGLFLSEIERDGLAIAAVGPEEVLRANDRLVFVGVVDSVVELQKIRGLIPATNQIVKLDAPRPQRRLVEAVVSNTSPLVGRSVREGRFRSVYNAVVIAVARNGERVPGKIGDIVLRTGDTLLLEAPRPFIEQHKNSRDFYLVSQIENSAPVRHEKALLSLAILAAMAIAASLENFTRFGMLECAVVAAGLMILSRCCYASVARKSVDWQVLVMIAASLALGTALDKSGAAATIARELISLASGDPLITLAAIYGVTMVATNLISNNAAAAMVFPIAMATARDLDANPMTYAMTIMMAASACFATPIGYQTNLMVMAPGGYKFSDYLRIGVPLNLLMWITTMIVAPLVWPLQTAP